MTKSSHPPRRHLTALEGHRSGRSNVRRDEGEAVPLPPSSTSSISGCASDSPSGTTPSNGFSPVWVHDIGIGGGFALFGFRVAARGLTACWTVQECFDRALGGDATEALGAITTFARILGRCEGWGPHKGGQNGNQRGVEGVPETGFGAGRRRERKAPRKISLAMPACVRVTHDELSYLSAMAALHHGVVAGCEAHLAWLFAGRPDPRAVEALGAFGDGLAAHGLWVETPPAQGL